MTLRISRFELDTPLEFSTQLEYLIFNLESSGYLDTVDLNFFQLGLNPKRLCSFYISHGVNSLTLVLVVKQLSTSETGFLKFWVVQTLNHLAAVYVRPSRVPEIFETLLRVRLPNSFHSGYLIVTASTMRKREEEREKEEAPLTQSNLKRSSHTTTTSQ